MLKRSAIFLSVFLSYMIILGHSIISHHHHDEVELNQPHHDDDDSKDHDDHDHNLFSFGAIEHHFILALFQVDLNLHSSIQLFIACNFFCPTNFTLTATNNIYKTYQEFPPPENYHYSCGLRAPPTC